MKIEGVKTVQEYLEAIPEERKEPMKAVRKLILDNLPEGYTEGFAYGMIGYVIPLSRYPVTYNKQPLIIAALASQKNFMSLYLMGVYGDKETEEWFKAEYKKSGKKLDIGKSCLHFKKLDDLPLKLIGEVIARVSVEKYIMKYEQSRQMMKK